ncbi:MAG: hypothetical protein ACRD9S_23405 [Pyrinomonadaceae bacterium]
MRSVPLRPSGFETLQSAKRGDSVKPGVPLRSTPGFTLSLATAGWILVDELGPGVSLRSTPGFTLSPATAGWILVTLSPATAG